MFSQVAMAKYIVLDTGYTSRMINFRECEPYDGMDKEERELEFRMFCGRTGLVYIKDNLWGSKPHSTSEFVSPAIDFVEANNIRNFVNYQKLDGVAVFKVDLQCKRKVMTRARSLVEELGDLAFCGFCVVECIYGVKYIGDFCVVSVDCESG